MKNFAVLVSFVILILAGFFIWFTSSIAPKSPRENYKTFVVTPGSHLPDISKKLQKEGFIKNSLAFQILATTAGLAKKIQAGSFYLSSHLSASEIAKELTKGTFDVWVTIPEGLRVEEIGQILNSKLGIAESEFLKISKEGYMFPDTYLIQKSATAADIAKIMRDNFEKRLSSDLEQILKTGGLEQTIILASIVEREAKFDTDRPVVAGILQKRLKAGVSLGADATVQYATGYQESEQSWWKKTLTEADLEINSPYNTRKFAGLPPGPICNPGLSSIRAVSAPKTSDFFYYLSDKDGKMHYAATLSEHIENIRKYL